MSSINNFTKKYAQQRWLTAHNAWNTNQGPDFNNQNKTITELLDYGVRGLALDVYGDDEASLHLQHGHGNDATRSEWKDILKEITDWMELDKNKHEAVTLFFESYLKGPKSIFNKKNALTGLNNSLARIPYYRSGKVVTTEIKFKTLKQLVTGIGVGEDKEAVTKPHRLFAFIEKEPDEGKQELFPVMAGTIAENVYGDDCLDKTKWVNLREGSTSNGDLTFMNHFGNGPKGNEFDRNDRDFMVQHAHAFAFAFNGRYPNFTSLDKINWEDGHLGPSEAMEFIRTFRDVNVTKFSWLDSNDHDDYDFQMGTERIVGITVTKNKAGKSIQKITPIRAKGKTDPAKSVRGIQVVNRPGSGVVNLRYRLKGEEWGEWLTEHETITKKDKNLGTHIAQTDIVGIGCRTQENYGVTDLAIACRRGR